MTYQDNFTLPAEIVVVVVEEWNGLLLSTFTQPDPWNLKKPIGLT